MAALKIGFLIQRSSSTKQFCPLVIEALARRYSVYFLCSPHYENADQAHPLNIPIPKNIDFPNQNKVIFLEYKRYPELSSLIKNTGLTDLFVTDLLKSVYRLPLLEAKKNGTRIHSTQWYGDYLSTPPDLLNLFDNYFIYSPAMVNFYQQTYPETPATLYQDKFIVTGNPVADPLPQILADRQNILKKYHLPNHKKIVLFFTQNFYPYFWTRDIFLKENRLVSLWQCLKMKQWTHFNRALFDPRYRQLFTQLKKWCQANQAILVVKSRFKHKEPSWLATLADHILTDTTTWYPAQSLELAAISDLVVSIYSGTVLDAVMAGSYHLNLAFPNYIDPLTKSVAFFNEGLFHCPGATESWPYHQFAKKLWQYQLTDFPKKINSQVKTNYLKTYQGPLDYKASQKIIDKLES